jgi:hypothetical protein
MEAERVPVSERGFRGNVAKTGVSKKPPKIGHLKTSENRDFLHGDHEPPKRFSFFDP